MSIISVSEIESKNYDSKRIFMVQVKDKTFKTPTEIMQCEQIPPLRQKHPNPKNKTVVITQDIQPCGNGFQVTIFYGKIEKNELELPDERKPNL